MAAFTHHIFVCCRAREPGHPRGSCDPDRSENLLKQFETEIEQNHLSSVVRANRAECLDQCEHGPVVVIYPHAIWYGNVGLHDVSRIVRETIVHGRILADLQIHDDCLNNLGCPHVCEFRVRQAAAHRANPPAIR